MEVVGASKARRGPGRREQETLFGKKRNGWPDLEGEDENFPWDRSVPGDDFGSCQILPRQAGSFRRNEGGKGKRRLPSKAALRGVCRLRRLNGGQHEKEEERCSPNFLEHGCHRRNHIRSVARAT